MKKQNLINLIRYHSENNNDAFVSEVAQIARDFDEQNDELTARYIMELVSSANFYVPQNNYKNLNYLSKVKYSTRPLFLPNSIEDDIVGITRAITNHSGLSKFLFYGAPGSGKTESAYQVARLLNRDILSVNFEQLVDSRLGETPKNVALLFDEINYMPPNKTVIVFDELDSIVLDRINRNDLREMGRVTSVFLKELDKLNEHVIIIATTNLFDNLDKALVRRFDALISFDRYSNDDLIQIADEILVSLLKKVSGSKQNIRLFNKILKCTDKIPYPGDLKQIIKTCIAFSDPSSGYDYLRKFYMALKNIQDVDIVKLKDEGFTTREIEILSKIPKSSVSRILKGKS